MLRIKIKTLVFLAVAACAACANRSQTAEQTTVIDGFTQGGTYHIVYKSNHELDLKNQIDSIFQVIDNSMSLFNPHSLINRLNRNETDSVDHFIAGCIAQAAEVSHLSDGLYDITIKPLTAAYGFTGDSAVVHPRIDSLLELVGYQKIAVKQGRLIKQDSRMQIDLNSIAPGATSDYLALFLEKQGIEDYIIEVGGEIRCRGLNAKNVPWRVGIDRPVEGNFTPGADLQVIIGLSGEGLATSGNYRKFYTDPEKRKIVHTINPKTGSPEISNLLSATVVASSAALADALGTTFMVMGVDKSREFLEQHPEIQAYLIYSDAQNQFQTYITPGMMQKIVPDQPL